GRADGTARRAGRRRRRQRQGRCLRPSAQSVGWLGSGNRRGDRSPSPPLGAPHLRPRLLDPNRPRLVLRKWSPLGSDPGRHRSGGRDPLPPRSDHRPRRHPGRGALRTRRSGGHCGRGGPVPNHGRRLRQDRPRRSGDRGFRARQTRLSPETDHV
ncbi:MAG: 2-Methylcitrate dehydratase AcnD, partial [uncultured Thermomicrobiales bacterium]